MDKIKTIAHLADIHIRKLHRITEYRDVFNRLYKKLDKLGISNKNEINDFILFKRLLFTKKRKSLKNILKKYCLEDKFDLSLRVESLKLDELIKIFRAVNL